jgi:hypothetical protein
MAELNMSFYFQIPQALYILVNHNLLSRPHRNGGVRMPRQPKNRVTIVRCGLRFLPLSVSKLAFVCRHSFRWTVSLRQYISNSCIFSQLGGREFAKYFLRTAPKRNNQLLCLFPIFLPVPFAHLFKMYKEILQFASVRPIKFGGFFFFSV